jgi:tight adherence protein B
MTMSLLMVGVVVLAGAVALLAFALLASPVPRVAQSRRSARVAPGESAAGQRFRGFVAVVDRSLKGRSWVPFSAAELELADVRKPVSVVVTWILVGSAAGAALGSLALRSPVLGIVLAAAVPLGVKVVLRVKTARRRAAFAKQLDPTLRIIASALRAGQSLQVAMASVGLDAEAPMSEEMAQITNEARVGRDLVVAMRESADRMQSEDLRWFTEAVEVQRDTGGNLNDIIDTVAETIRERAEIREKVKANASEGNASAWVLMALPVVLGLVFSILRPGYLNPLLFTTGGQLLLGFSAVMYFVAYIWMRAIVNIKV